MAVFESSIIDVCVSPTTKIRPSASTSRRIGLMSSSVYGRRTINASPDPAAVRDSHHDRDKPLVVKPMERPLIPILRRVREISTPSVFYHSGSQPHDD